MLKKFVLLFLAVFLFADVTNMPASKNAINSGMKIVDIRTKGEWKETGVVKNAILITFFDERGAYDAASFLAQLGKHVKKGEKFAIICRTGSRTSAVAPFLASQGHNVVNLQGGVFKLLSEGYTLSPY